MLNRLVLFLPFILLAIGCQDGSKEDSKFTRAESIKLKQYMVEGERLYQLHCSNCHKIDGEGLKRLIPPLESSDFLEGSPESLFCVIKNGLKGEITVNGIMYNQPMPANPNLTDLDIAEISTYVYNKFIKKEVLLLPGQVSSGLKNCPTN